MKFKRSVLLLVLSCCFHALASGTDVQKLNVEENGFVGHYYEPSVSSAGTAKQPVIVLGGSEGGIPSRLANVIAADGFPVLAVAYFKEESLPVELEKIPLEYFEKAKKWLLHKHPENENLTVAGWSKGAELSLLLASKDATFNRVIAIAPSAVVWAGILNDWQKTPGSSWTSGQKELDFVQFNPTGAVSGLLDLYSQSLANRQDGGKASIKTEEIQGSVYLFSGGKDEIWPSVSMAESICERMKQNESSSCTHFSYPELDHLLDYKLLDGSQELNREFLDSVGAGE